MSHKDISLDPNVAKRRSGAVGGMNATLCEGVTIEAATAWNDPGPAYTNSLRRTSTGRWDIDSSSLATGIIQLYLEKLPPMEADDPIPTFKHYLNLSAVNEVRRNNLPTTAGGVDYLDSIVEEFKAEIAKHPKEINLLDAVRIGKRLDAQFLLAKSAPGTLQL